MAKVFVSYSRKDIEFAKRLTAELEKNGLDVWIDWEGIPPTVDWWREIEKGIEEAGAFIFLISPDSAASKVCGQEIDSAVRNGKRLIPLVVRQIEAKETPASLSHLNWIFFRETDEFDTGIQKLLTAINTDYEWVETHQQLQGKALEWERNKRDGSFLLRGSELQEAEQQLAINSSKEPHPTDLQREYVFESRKATDRQRRINTMIGIAGLVALAALAVFGLVQAQRATASRNDAQAASTLAVANAQTAVVSEQEARRQTQIARTRELSTLAIIKRPNNFAQSLLLGVELFERMPDLMGTRGVLLNNAQMDPQLLQYLAGHNGFVYSVAFSPDGTTLASSGRDQKIVLWDLASRLPLGEPLTGPGEPYSLAYGPDGKILAAGNLDGTITLWDIAARKAIGDPLKGHTKDVNSVAFSPDGKILASGSSDGSIILWDLAAHKPAGDPIAAHDGKIWKVSFSPDGSTLASGGTDWAIKLWDVATRQQIGEPLNGHTATVWSVLFSPDGRTLVSGSDDRTIRFWDVATGQPLGDLIKNRSGVYSLAFNQDGTALASGNADNTVSLWDAARRLSLGQPLTGHSNWINSVAFSPDGKTLASGSQDNTIILWDTSPRPSVAKPISGPGPVYSVAFSPDGKSLASGGVGSDSSPFMMWDVAAHKSSGQPFSGPTAPVWRVAFSPDGKTLASGSEDQTVTLWNAATREAIGEPLKGHTGTVWSVAYGPDGKTIASGSDDTTVRIWDATTRKPVGKPLAGHTSSIWSVTYSPDGRILASASGDSTIRLWDTTAWQAIGKPLAAHAGAVYAIAFSPDGKSLASAGDDGNIILWDVAGQKTVREPVPGQGAVYSLAFSPDGRTLASGNLDGSINLWDTTGYEAIGEPLTGHSDWVNSLAFSPDGETLASGSNDGTIILWDMDPQAWMAQSCQRVGRNFTTAEWAQFFGGEEYRKTCEQWPLGSEPLPTVVAAAPSEAAPATAAPTGQPTVTPVPSSYTEDFNDGMASWSSFMTSGTEQQVKTTLANGSFQVQLSPLEDRLPWAYWINDASTYTSVQVEAVVTNNGNNANGVSLLCQYNDAGWYEFSISSTGLYTIYAFDTSLPPIQGHVALATGGSAAIKSGRETNTYTVVCRGSELSLAINGTPATTVTDRLYNFTEGKIGIGLSSPLKLPVNVQFDSLTVSVPQ